MSSHGSLPGQEPVPAAGVSPPAQAAATVRAGRVRLLRAAMTVVLLVLILRAASPQAILGALADASYAPLALGLALGGVYFVLKAFRWTWLLGRLGVACTREEGFRSYLGGLAVGLTTPGRVGEVARSLFLPRADRLFVSGAALLDKIFDVAVIVGVGAGGCFLNGLPGPGTLLALAALALAGAPYLPSRAIDRLSGLVPFVPVRRVAQALARPVATATPRTLLLAGGQAVLVFALTMFQFHIYLSAFGPAPVEATLFVLPLMILSNLIPLTISGLGVREWAAVLLFREYGVASAVAVNVSLLLFLSNSLAPGVVGALLATGWQHAGASDGERVA